MDDLSRANDVSPESSPNISRVEESSIDLQNDNAERELRLLEQQLKIDELRLKIKDLNRPEYRRINTWISLVAVLIAFGGVIGQNILSNIKSERAHLELKEAVNKRDSAIKYVDWANEMVAQAKVKERFAKDSQQIAEMEYFTIQRKIDSANKYLDNLKDYVSKMSREKSKNKSDFEQNGTIKRLIVKAEDALRYFYEISNVTNRDISFLISTDKISWDKRLLSSGRWQQMSSKSKKLYIIILTSTDTESDTFTLIPTKKYKFRWNAVSNNFFIEEKLAN